MKLGIEAILDGDELDIGWQFRQHRGIVVALGAEENQGAR
jgi:hypothetical protein